MIVEEIFEEYIELSKEMTSRPICLVEGNNRFFYQKLPELHKYDVEDGGDCIKIRGTITASAGMAIVFCTKFIRATALSLG